MEYYFVLVILLVMYIFFYCYKGKVFDNIFSSSIALRSSSGSSNNADFKFKKVYPKFVYDDENYRVVLTDCKRPDIVVNNLSTSHLYCDK